MTESEDRVKRGEEVYQELSLGSRTAAGLPQYELIPDMGKWVTASLFGDVWGRPGLEKKVRSIATMTALTVLGREAQLKGHVGYALNLGWNKDEISELFMHLVFYGGLPASLNALAVALEVFNQRGLDHPTQAGTMADSDERLARGMKVLEELTLGHPEEASGPEYDLVPGMEDWVTASLFGDVWGRPGLEMKMRSMATMSALTVLGRLPQLKGHVEWALNLGWTKDEISELFMHLALYGGLPASLNALAVAREVFQERGLIS